MRELVGWACTPTIRAEDDPAAIDALVTLSADTELLSAHRAEFKGTKLELLVARMLAKKIEDRPSSMAQTALELQEALDQLGAKSSRAVLVDPSSSDAGLVPDQIRVLHLVQALRASGNHELTAFLKQEKTLMTLSCDAFRIACWGVLATQLMGAPIDSAGLNCAVAQTASLVESVLDFPEEAPLDKAFLEGVAVLLKTLERGRRDLVIRALQPLSTNVRFPADLIPAWATLQTSGSWKSSMSLPQFNTEGTFDIDVDFSGDEGHLLDEASLIKRLNNPVSVDTVKQLISSNSIKLGFKKEE
jgi:hypothetical protein